MNTDRVACSSVKPTLCLFAALLIMISLAIPASAHVPLTAGGNENLSSAMHISDPGKSWAVYGTLDKDIVHYYSFDLEEGERIYLSLFKTADLLEKDFLPALLLLGPGFGGSSHLPENLKLPPQASSLKILVAESRGAFPAVYEPFGPSSFREVAELNLSAPKSARYYAVVYDNSNGKANAVGHYGLAVGYREEFGFLERITTPVRLISVYLWEGQSLAVILIPYLVAEILALLMFWRSSRKTSYFLAGSLAGFLFLASSASVLTQMVFNLTRAPFGPEVYITLAIAFLHALLGVVTIRLARGEAGLLQRVLLAVIGTIALLAGSGLIMGPILALAASLLPSRSGSIFGKPAAKTPEK
ncbi:MAG: hypothetical protein A4E49_01394 [Methanosaeta sp. PtaU1.Bin112]|nr:MAG: hypothetical protein A4E49_01394 [Methanosaeta sp. PtaU1.Bin112]